MCYEDISYEDTTGFQIATCHSCNFKNISFLVHRLNAYDLTGVSALQKHKHYYNSENTRILHKSLSNFTKVLHIGENELYILMFISWK